MFNSTSSIDYLIALSVGIVLAITVPTATISADSPFEYVNPRPQAELVSAYTTIAVRHGEEIDPTSINQTQFTVTGAKSGLHPGAVILADDAKTVIFEPETPFTPSEVVTVTVASGLQTIGGETLDGVSYQFTVSGNPLHTARVVSPAKIEASPTSINKTDQKQFPYRTLPDDFPVYTVTTTAPVTTDGYIFLANFRFLPNIHHSIPYLLILDNQGEPVFYRKMPEGAAIWDFKKQPNGLLSYWREISFTVDGQTYSHGFVLLNHNYHVVDVYEAGHGYEIDFHDLQLLSNGHTLLLAYDRQTIDMSQIVEGGQPEAKVSGLIVQELDPSRNVLFEWRSWDHFAITETMGTDLTTTSIDYVHGNSVERDYDGHLLISSRHIHEVTKINRDTADIVWRMGGGIKNEFTFINDQENGFFGQHDARRLPNGHITLFDNRFPNRQPRYSRAVEYEVDEVNKTATLVWEYRHEPDIYAEAMANTQRLANGNTVIGWGSGFPSVTEVTPQGETLFELTFGEDVSYQSFRFPWEGHPTEPPTLIAETENPTVTLYYSWNGATEVASYEVYGSSVTTTPTTLLDTVSKTGFETTTVLTDLARGTYYFQVLPLDKGGQPMTASAVISVTVTASNNLETYLPILVK